jgi:hypothetical protein
MSAFQIYSIALFICTLLIPFYTFNKLHDKFNGMSLFTFSIFISVISMSIIIILRWYFYDFYLEYHLSILDYNHDGIYTPEETSNWNDTDKKIYTTYIADGGRNVFAFIMFPIFAFLYSIISISIYSIILRFKQKHNS